MKIFICGSMYFSKEMLENKKKLEELSHVVDVPCDAQDFADNPEMTTDNHEENYKWCVDKDLLRKCFDSIAESDAILLLNYPKNGLNGYIGTSGVMETGLAYYLRKKIFLLYPPPSPQEVKSSHEILIMQPIIINGDLSKIK